MLLGIGKWKFTVDTMFYRGDAILTAVDKDGEYDVDIELTGIEIPNPGYGQLQVEGNTLTGVATTDLLKGKEIPFSLTFDGDTATGFLKVPFMGKIKLKDGQRIG